MNENKRIEATWNERVAMFEALVLVMNEKRESVARDILAGRLSEAEQGLERLKVMERYVARDKKELGIE